MLGVLASSGGASMKYSPQPELPKEHVPNHNHHRMKYITVSDKVQFLHA